MKKILFIFLYLIVFSCGKDELVDELVFDLNASGDLSEQTIEQAKKKQFMVNGTLEIVLKRLDQAKKIV